MYPEFVAILVLGFYAAIAVVLVARSISQCQDGWEAWLLYNVQRLYGGLVFHWRANRRCPFPAHGPALIVANHRSPVDPMMLWLNHHLREHEKSTNMRVICFLTAREYCQIRGIRWLCRAMQSIPTNRDGKDIGSAKEALRRLKHGCLVGVFPEGRINLGESLMEGSTGVAWLALRARVPVYPVFLHDTPQGDNMVQPFCTLSRVRVIYGDPIDLSQYYECRKTHEILQEVTELMMTRLAELGGLIPPKADQANREVRLPLKRRTG